MAVSKQELLEARVATLEARAVVLEAEVIRLKRQLAGVSDKNGTINEDWLDKIYGIFADDPIFDEIARLGREYRESLRPGPSRKKTKTKGGTKKTKS
jgi:hypothetical protein